MHAGSWRSAKYETAQVVGAGFVILLKRLAQLCVKKTFEPPCHEDIQRVHLALSLDMPACTVWTAISSEVDFVLGNPWYPNDSPQIPNREDNILDLDNSVVDVVEYDLASLHPINLLCALLFSVTVVLRTSLHFIGCIWG
ncbi:hypothetical protein RRG08_067262 [Elysia crispata]|uniref:Uncharacterized protein n=1 Tax=Elysia crispata TaxID=231223 RepID=A0AAE0Y8V1_9GAST|nr:hypothetical protein RRG08_067262 [Elysia crispata]